MTMKIDSREIDGAVILDLNGRLVLGEDTILMREQIRDLISKGKKRSCSTCRLCPT
jgi:anti-sigma B factor antagonist